MCIVLRTLLTLLSLLLYSFEGVSSLLRMCSKGIKNKGFTQSRWDAVLGYWGAVCRHGPCGPTSSFGPWDWWVPPDLHGFYRWFIKQVVDNCRNVGGRKCTNWLREDLGSTLCAWLRPDFVPPSPFLVIKDPQTQSSQILVEPHLIDAEFRKALMPFYCRSGHPVVTVDQCLDFVAHLLPQEPQFDLPRITGRDSQEVVRAKKSSAGGLDGWAWNDLKALPLPWLSGFAILLELVETKGVWPQGSFGCLYCHDPGS